MLDDLSRMHSSPISAVVGAAAGAALAAAHLTALRYNVQLYVGPGGGSARAIAVHTARSAALVVAFVAAALSGAHVLVGAICGFTITHAAILVGARSRR